MFSKKVYTLIFIRKELSVLLGFKTRGIGKGLWNGFGGKVEVGETVQEGARRELKEESNLTADLKQIGIVRYITEEKSLEEVVHIFTSFEYSGEIQASEEMNPIQWFPIADIPFGNMWPDAKAWIPLMLNTDYFNVKVVYVNDDIKEITKDTFENYDKMLKYV